MREFLSSNSDVIISYAYLHNHEEMKKRYKSTDESRSTLYSAGDGTTTDRTSSNNIAHKTEQTQLQAQIPIIPAREPHPLPIPTASPIAHPPHIPNTPPIAENPIMHSPHT